ncbi:MAG: hypothetical protein NUV53_04610 [Patescibacteria group bacterium]|nr:hypothetical protein [Patescibacteria group bacterium]
MMNATIIPEQKIFERWDLLAPALRDALVSEENSDIVWKTCTDEHLSEEKIHEVARIVSWVMLGFLHPEDIAREVQFSTGIHPEVARAIASPLIKKIFEPMRDDLENIYAPTPLKEGVSASSVITDTESTPFPIIIDNAEKTETVDKTLANLGKGISDEPFFKEPPARMESASSAPLPENPFFDNTTVGEKPVPFPPASSDVPPAFHEETSSETMPFMIHEEPSASSIPHIGDFSLNIKPEEFGPSREEFQNIPKADIEIGGGDNPAVHPQEGFYSPDDNQPERIVHYSDFHTPIPAETEKNTIITPFSSLTKPTPSFKEKNPEDAFQPPPSPSSETIMNIGNFGGDISSAHTSISPEPAPPVPTPKKKGVFGSFFGLPKSKKNIVVTDTAPIPDIPPSPLSFKKISPDIPPKPKKVLVFDSASFMQNAPRKENFSSVQPAPPPVPKIIPSPAPQDKTLSSSVLDISSLSGDLNKESTS